MPTTFKKWILGFGQQEQNVGNQRLLFWVVDLPLQDLWHTIACNLHPVIVLPVDSKLKKKNCIPPLCPLQFSLFLPHPLFFGCISNAHILPEFPFWNQMIRNPHESDQCPYKEGSRDSFAILRTRWENKWESASQEWAFTRHWICLDLHRHAPELQEAKCIVHSVTRVW